MLIMHLRSLKEHGNEADFLGFLQKLVPHIGLTLPYVCSDFGFEFAEIFIIEKRLPDSASWRLFDSASQGVRESAFECLKENLASQKAGDSPTRRVREWLWRVGESFFDYEYLLKFEAKIGTARNVV
jgi:hypothetical protein